MNQKLLAEVPEELSANFETDYLQGAVDGYAKDGTYYGVPIEMNVEYGLFYNREDAAAAGVPDGPKTFDDVMKIAKNSAKFNGDVQEYGGLEFYNGDNFAALFLSWIMQNGGDFWNEDQTKFVLTSPEAKEAWQKLVDLVTVEKVTDTKHITAKMPTEQYFFANKAAQLVKGSWASAVGDDLENENWKYVFMPPVKGDIPYFAVESGWGYVVSENSKNKDTAWDFVKYCMEPENAKEFNLVTGTVASLKAIIDDEGYQSDERNVRVSDQYQYLQYARSVGPVQDMDFVKKTLLDTFTKAASGSIGTDEALEEMETSINNHIQELLKQAK